MVIIELIVNNMMECVLNNIVIPVLYTWVVKCRISA